MPKTIVVDPGHGGTDPGATGFDLKEKDLTLKISKRIVSELLPYECNVRLTRKTDINPGLDERALLVNSLKADLFVSIHINAGKGTGFESYTYSYALELSEQYRSLVHGEVVAYLNRFGIADRGQKSANFAVLRLTEMSSMLLENLFIDSSSDVLSLQYEPFIAGLSYSIALGIAKALSLPLKEDPWDPVWEISQLLTDKLINSPKEADTYISWGDLATVLNRMRNVPPPTAQIWDQEGEINLLIRDNIINTPRKPNQIALWGEFATALNRLRGRVVPADSWNPAAEIQALIADRFLFSPRSPSTELKWGEFATVLNRYRGVGG